MRSNVSYRSRGTIDKCRPRKEESSGLYTSELWNGKHVRVGRLYTPTTKMSTLLVGNPIHMNTGRDVLLKTRGMTVLSPNRTSGSSSASFKSQKPLKRAKENVGCPWTPFITHTTLYFISFLEWGIVFPTREYFTDFSRGSHHAVYKTGFSLSWAYTEVESNKCSRPR